MERRADERFSIEFQFEVRVTVTGTQRLSAVGQVSDLSNSGLSVTLPFQLTPGDLVEIEIADSVIRGHVVYSNPDQALYQTVYRTGIKASHVALGSTDLAGILQRILLETSPEIQGLEIAQIG